MSVLPSSTTSGAFEPASAVSSRVYRFAHCWYSTLTWAFVFSVKRRLASSTTFFQLDSASTISQTLIVLPWPLSGSWAGWLLPPLLHAAAPMSVAAMAAAAAIVRLTRPP
jgi:hypothetical protein